MNYDICNMIQNITDYREITKLIEYCEIQQRKIIGNEWERIYKERCPNHYLSLNDFVTKIDEANLIEVQEYENIEDMVYKYPANATINHIMDEAKDKKLHIPKDVSDMICEACVCCECEYLKEHLGYNCDECKKHLFYTGYQGYCDE